MKRSTPLSRNIGKKVKYYRELRGLTQKELAARLQTVGCDLTESMVGQIEIGYRATSVFEIDNLLEVLHPHNTALVPQDEGPGGRKGLPVFLQAETPKPPSGGGGLMRGHPREIRLYVPTHPSFAEQMMPFP